MSLRRDANHEHRFPEEQEPSGRLILGPCLICDLSAMDALNEMYEALRFICTTNDSGPWIDVYRRAGGGYEGLQAVAAACIGKDT